MASAKGAVVRAGSPSPRWADAQCQIMVLRAGQSPPDVGDPGVGPARQAEGWKTHGNSCAAWRSRWTIFTLEKSQEKAKLVVAGAGSQRGAVHCLDCPTLLLWNHHVVRTCCALWDVWLSVID